VTNGPNDVRPQNYSKDDIDKLIDEKIARLWKQAKTYVIVFFAGFIFLAGIGIGFKRSFLTPFMEWAYPAEVIHDDIYKLPGHDEPTDRLNATLSYLHEHVDSGYSKVIIFPASGKRDPATAEHPVAADNTVLFYARSDQDAQVTIKVDAGSQPPFEYNATVDNRPIEAHPLSSGDTVANIPIREKLDRGVGVGLGPNLHVLKISPNKPQADTIIFNCVILVQNLEVKK
jgi:hypothetical protein